MPAEVFLSLTSRHPDNDPSLARRFYRTLNSNPDPNISLALNLKEMHLSQITTFLLPLSKVPNRVAIHRSGSPLDDYAVTELPIYH